MKTKIIILIAFVLIQSSAVFAQFSILHLSMSDNAVFTVSVDNQRHTTPSNNYVINNLTAGRHHLIVAKTFYDIYGRQASQFVFNGFVSIPTNTQVDAVINQYGQFQVLQSYQLATAHHNRDRVRGRNHPTHNNHHTAYNSSSNCNAVNNANQVEFVIQTMQQSSFDSSKLAIAKQAVASGRYSSNDILKMMNQLTFENNRLNLAKFAYHYVVDPSNYFVVNQGFTFSSSINQLQQAIF